MSALLGGGPSKAGGGTSGPAAAAAVAGTVPVPAPAPKASGGGAGAPSSPSIADIVRDVLRDIKYPEHVKVWMLPSNSSTFNVFSCVCFRSIRLNGAEGAPKVRYRFLMWSAYLPYQLGLSGDPQCHCHLPRPPDILCCRGTPLAVHVKAMDEVYVDVLACIQTLAHVYTSLRSPCVSLR